MAPQSSFVSARLDAAQLMNHWIKPIRFVNCIQLHFYSLTEATIVVQMKNVSGLDQDWGSEDANTIQIPDSF